MVVGREAGGLGAAALLAATFSSRRRPAPKVNSTPARNGHSCICHHSKPRQAHRVRDVLLLHRLLHVGHVRLEGGVDAHVAVAPLLAERLPVLLARPPRLLGVLEADKRLLSGCVGVGAS